MNLIALTKLRIFITKFVALIFILFPLPALSGLSASSTSMPQETVQARSPSQETKSSSSPIEIEFILSNGYRRDDLDWNIAGNKNGSNPNILSELKWDDIEIYQVKLQNRILWPKIVYLRAALDYGWIFDGKNQDSDYLGDNRSFEFSRSNNSADDGDVMDASVAVGYPFRFRFSQNELFSIIPLVGYSYHEQNLTITNGYQTVATPGLTPGIGPISGLDSSYDTEWKGPWIGVDLNFKSKNIKTMADRIETYGSFEYHWADYDAEANWNLREDLAHPTSFKHDADGNGVVIAIGFNIVLSSHWMLNLNYDYQTWSTDDGTDRIFSSSGSTADTRLNEVNWDSHTLSLGVGVRF